jgi:hypothetical protein
MVAAGSQPTNMRRVRWMQADKEGVPDPTPPGPRLEPIHPSAWKGILRSSLAVSCITAVL